MEIPLEKFFQIFSHGCLTAFDGMADGALVNALLPGDLAVALAEDQMRFYTDALHLRQRIESVPQVDEQLHTMAATATVFQTFLNAICVRLFPAASSSASASSSLCK